jgi:dephospho-CoA kinase
MMVDEQEGLEPKARGIVVGLTGGIAAGKTTALRAFADLGAETYSADEYVHELYAKSEIKEVLRKRFGPDIFGPDKEVDRRVLLKKVTKDPDSLRWLENFVIPKVSDERVRRMNSVGPGRVLVCESPLLVEGGFQSRFDLVVTVEAPFGVRQQRSMARLDEPTLLSLEKRRATVGQRIAAADYSYTNDAGLPEMKAFVRMVYERALAMARGEAERPRAEKA